MVQLDGLHLVWGSGQELILQGASALARYLEHLETIVPGANSHDTTRPDRMVSKLLEHPVGKVAWVSDFADPGGYQVPLAMLRKQGCRVRGWLPSFHTDRLPKVGGMIRFADPESGREEVLQVDSALRRAMVAELQSLAKNQDAVFKTVGYPLARFPVPEPGDLRIGSWTGDGMIYS